ncbi:hypothetical protein GCM10011369_12160 [Neiella marina]|uniref:EAL domain-containing protein n=1 Tax=Neiella marina TaxID=508461 RepID=A0A8J2XNH2_9GAMM|nr:EAL domain-containing protein [Neiella marina]GGA71964.1 hypothetical protein GCM10011369_12160 [Neiella marina]
MSSKPYTIGVVTPYLSGFFLGELANALRDCAKEQNLNLITIRANGFGSYDMPLALDYMDGLLIILNSASTRLVEQAIQRGIPVVSTAADYFPLPVEQVCSDQTQGMRDAFEHLVKLNHTRIGFAGDLSIVDIRSRFQEYKERFAQWGLPYNPDWTLSVHEPTLPGGREAGRIFIERDCDCTAIICATDLIAVGLIEQLKKINKRCPEDIAVVGIDNTILGATRTPALSSVDQNLQRLASEAIDRLIARIEGDKYHPKPLIVNQQLIVRGSCGAPLHWRSDSEDPQTIRNKLIDDFAKAPTDNNESAMALAKGGFDSILNLSSLYGPFLNWACFANWQSEGPQKKHLKVTQLFSEQNRESNLSKQSDQTCLPQSYPPRHLLDHDFPDHFALTLVPISAEDDDPWGVLALIDDLTSDTSNSSYSMFDNYLDMLSLFIERDALIASVRNRERKAKDLAEQLEVVANTSNDGIWDWNLKTNDVEWNTRLLEMLGFEHSGDIRAYRNMKFFERVHPDDQDRVRQQVLDHLENDKVFKTSFRLRGADDDYLWVDASGESIRNPLGQPERFVGSVTDITEQRRSQERIQHMAYHDALTGLPNRIMLNERLKTHIRDHALQPKAVMLMDLNRFKYVNDTYGHDVGDALLRHVAKQLKGILRGNDFFARFGGDEFVFLCDVTTEQAAIELAKRILVEVESRFKYNGIELSSHGSLGISFYPKDGQTADDLIKKADIAMYRAKQIKSTKAMLYALDMDADVELQATMEQKLKVAMENDELAVHYQPQIDPNNGELVGMEALARWQSDCLGHVSPAQFIPIAEEAGLITKLGGQVARKAMVQLAKWQQQFPERTIKLSINVSPGELMRSRFATEFIECVKSTDVDISQITVEITESAAIGDLDHSRAMLQQLVDAGISVSLDDFGTGYSSLSLLKQLPLEWVKIDRSFISNIDSEAANKDIVRSIVMMCHSFGYKTVAEGVETSAELKFISNAGCDLVQGFYYSKPLPADEFEKRYLQYADICSASDTSAKH